MIRLIDLLASQGICLSNYKVHLATDPGLDWQSPLDAFLDGDKSFQDWQERQTKQNFTRKLILSLIQMENGSDRWLFAGVWEVLGVRRTGGDPPFHYRTRLLSGQGDLMGRIVVRYKRPFRQSYPYGETISDKLEVISVTESRYSLRKFLGYNSVVVSNPELKRIVTNEEPSWRSALSHVKGVYLITDRTNGKLYVGSATGSGGLWERWCAYAENGHGQNVELEQLLRSKGDAHAANFQYSILEIADFHATEEQIQQREAHWKTVLLSRNFGYNAN